MLPFLARASGNPEDPRASFAMLNSLGSHQIKQVAFLAYGRSLAETNPEVALEQLADAGLALEAGQIVGTALGTKVPCFRHGVIL